MSFFDDQNKLARGRQTWVYSCAKQSGARDHRKVCRDDVPIVEGCSPAAGTPPLQQWIAPMARLHISLAGWCVCGSVQVLVPSAC